MAPCKTAAKESTTKQLRSKRHHNEISSADEDSQAPLARKILRTTTASQHDSDEDVLTSSAPRIEPKPAEEQQAVREGREDGATTLESQRVHFDAAARKTIPKKMMVKRRRTLSPALAGGRMQHFKISGRKSLPTTVKDQGRYTPDHLHFSPLRSVLDERVRKIEREQSSPFHSASYIPPQEQVDDDEDILVLDDEQSQRPSHHVIDGKAADVQLVQHRVGEHELAMNHKQCEIERLQLEQSILKLGAEASQARSQLQICEIEIRALGFGEEEEVSPVHAIRDALQRVRDGLSNILPTEVTLNASNAEYLDTISQCLQDFVEQWESQEIQLHENANVVSELRNQVDVLLQKLATQKVVKQDLGRELNSLAESDDAKQQQITELQINLNDEKEQRLQAEELVADLKEQLAEAESQNTDQQHGLDRLGQSLQKYRHEEQRLQDLISRMEDDHSSKIQELRCAKDEKINEYKKQLDQAKHKIDASEKESNEAKLKIEGLERRQAAFLTDREALLNKISTLDEELQTAQQSYDNAVADLDVANDVLDATAGEYELLFANTEETTDSSNSSPVSSIVDQAKHSTRLDGSISKMSLTAGKFRKEFQSLRLTKASLERRVESEAEAMLEMQSQRDEEIARLREALQDKHAKTLVVEQKAKEADRRWQDLYDSRTEEFRHLQVEYDLAHDELADVRENYAQLKTSFKAYIEDTRNRLQHLHVDESTALRNIERHQKSNDEAAQEYEMQMEDGRGILDVQEMGYERAESGQLAVQNRKQQRNYDSGFGVASDELL